MVIMVIVSYNSDYKRWSYRTVWEGYSGQATSFATSYEFVANITEVTQHEVFARTMARRMPCVVKTVSCLCHVDVKMLQLRGTSQVHTDIAYIGISITLQQITP